jgi:manganese efflux pump family protein
MDAAAAAAARGVAVQTIRARHIALVALFFGGFQAAMPVAGWLIGTGLGPIVQAWDHWVAFALLAGLGCRMLWEARHGGGAPRGNVFSLRVMVVLALATSIDALAAGIMLPMVQAPLLLSVVTIGVTTALMSIAGLFAGRRFGAAIGSRLDVIGGLVLIALGFKILIEHLSA